MSAAYLVVSTRSSAKPLAGAHRPEMVCSPTLVALRARSVKEQAEQQGRQLVTLLLPTRQDHISRPAIRQVCLIVCPRVEALEQDNVKNIQLLQPSP